MQDDEQLRQDVATANRILERLGLSHAFGHASARIPGTNTFLLPTRRSPGLAEAGNLLTIDTEGRIVAGEGEPNSEFWIHSRIYAARPDVGGVVHAHSPHCVCLTQVGEPHRIVHNQGGIFQGGVPEYSRVGLIRSRELGDLLAKTLGKGIAVMMRAHGVTTAFPDIRQAAVAACYLEESAAMQLKMLSAVGGDASRIRVVSDADAGPLKDQITGNVAKRAWEYFAAVAATTPLGGGQRM